MHKNFLTRKEQGFDVGESSRCRKIEYISFLSMMEVFVFASFKI